ncbi:translation initiation factor 2 subunit 3 [Pancytospora epiphaga]|nr:translation initiation factor 2 subunit 3 [Pancytospora epiphaga]
MSSRMEKQATINIGTIGHVAHGKSTIVRCISGTNTIKYKSELERNITIKLGYANAKIYKCECERPECYTTSLKNCSKCGQEGKLVRHVSFVDCPGHDVLMTTMLNGTAIMDAALLLVAANEPCPQPQTTEHLFAVEIMDLKKIVVIQNKVDLVSREQALEQHDQIREFLKTSNVNGPIVPTSGQFGVNINAVLDFIVNHIDEPVRKTEEDPRMIIIRSFDVNKPGTNALDLQGGVIGGSLVAGLLRVGDRVEVRPGLVTKENGVSVCIPFLATVTSLKAEKTSLEEAAPGGLIGVGTTMDSYFCKSDRLVGMVLGLKGTLPPVYSTILVSYQLFQKTVTQSREDLRADEHILLNIGSTSTGSKIMELTDNKVRFELIKPCCCNIGDRISISRKVKNNWRLIGFGRISEGVMLEIRMK